MIISLFKKTMFMETECKVAIYVVSLFLVPLFKDSLAFPDTCLSRRDGLLNKYFVKLAWLWTLTFCMMFLSLTSYTLCCCDIRQVLRYHMPRMWLATFFWFFWTELFRFIENRSGRCTMKGRFQYKSKLSSCNVCLGELRYIRSLFSINLLEYGLNRRGSSNC